MTSSSQCNKLSPLSEVLDLSVAPSHSKIGRELKRPHRFVYQVMSRGWWGGNQAQRLWGSSGGDGGKIGRGSCTVPAVGHKGNCRGQNLGNGS